jgi:hypothetical protein
MYYVCIENNQIISVLNHEPSVPDTVTVKEISDQDYERLTISSHYFDIPTLSILPQSNAVLAAREQQAQSVVLKKQLQDTDWQVLRHIRQKALGVPTSLSESEYLDLELERNRIAAQITH